jgi:hypothetical protein
MKPTQDDLPGDQALEERLRESFAAAVAAAPPTPVAVRTRLVELQVAPPANLGGPGVVARRFGALVAAAIAILVVA